MHKDFTPEQQIERARALRVNSTEVEKRLWYKLRSRQIDGHKFRRQHVVKHYILDFACDEHKLVVELDGGQHNHPEKILSDARRTEELIREGWRVLRFWNHEVIENMEGVVETIRTSLTGRGCARCTLGAKDLSVSDLCFTRDAAYLSHRERSKRSWAFRVRADVDSRDKPV